MARVAARAVDRARVVHHHVAGSRVEADDACRPCDALLVVVGHVDGIVVAEYWTALPPKHELEQRLQLMLREARERLARRELPSVGDD